MQPVLVNRFRALRIAASPFTAFATTMIDLVSVYVANEVEANVRA